MSLVAMRDRMATPVYRLTASLIILGTYVGLSPTSFAADYDIVINNGRVMDPETMYDDIANVGIKGNQIAAITKDKIKGKETINYLRPLATSGLFDK